MIKHALIRNTALAFLGFAGMGLGSCKKEVTQRVDQAFSAIYQVNPSDWKRDPSRGDYYLFKDLSVPEVDDFLSDNGAVLVYVSLDNQASWEAVPEVIDNIAYGSYHTSGTVGVDLQYADGSHAPLGPPGVPYFVKVVLVDATPLD
jgi:hypothetical protein